MGEAQHPRVPVTAVAEGPGRATTYAGSSVSGAALSLSAGLALIAAGLVICLGTSPRRNADLALLAVFTWFAPVWAAWQNGPPLVPSLATVVGGFTFPLIVHLVLQVAVHLVQLGGHAVERDG